MEPNTEAMRQRFAAYFKSRMGTDSPVIYCKPVGDEWVWKSAPKEWGREWYATTKDRFAASLFENLPI